MFDTFDCSYDPSYVLRDSVMTKPAAADYGECSARFSALAQEWLFLAVVNFESGFIWNHFYRDGGVSARDKGVQRDATDDKVDRPAFAHQHAHSDTDEHGHGYRHTDCHADGDGHACTDQHALGYRHADADAD